MLRCPYLLCHSCVLSEKEIGNRISEKKNRSKNEEERKKTVVGKENGYNGLTTVTNDH
jgi:hypothetical protein